MLQFKKRLLILFLLLFSAVTIVSCGDISSTTIWNTTTVTTSIPTTEQTTSLTTETPTTTLNTTSVTTQETTTAQTTTEQTTTEQTTTIITTTYYDNSRIEITSPGDLVYTINDSVDYTGMTVTYYDSEDNSTVLRDMDYTISNVDMSTYGEKTITITYGEYQASFNIQVNLPAYYMDAMNLTGQQLLTTLRTIIHTGFDGVTYGDARYILDETDRDPLNSNNLIEVYTGDSVPGAWDCDGVCVWNREHVWPQSGMPVSASNGTVNMASDLHNLKPADPSENGSRGNDYFDNVSQGDAYEPRDEVKGDIARILLYMVVMYEQLTLVDGTPNLSSYEMGLFSVLLQWNEQDPVDDFERNRNNVIYSYQGNYNPFIDYPEFATLIWG